MVSKLKKPLTLKQVLNIIDTALARQDSTAQGVWNVLTALRGPDLFSIKLKDTGTIPIRRKAFPETAKNRFANGAQFETTLGNEIPTTIGQSIYFANPNHATLHIMNAAKALGILDENS